MSAGAGTETWSPAISVTKALIIVGPGRANLTITGGFVYNPTVGEASKTFDLSGFTFSGNAGFDATAPNGTTPITGLKIHACTFRDATVRAIPLDGLEFGVFYDNIFTANYISVSIIGAGTNGWNYVHAFGSGNYPYFEDNTFDATTNATNGFVFETGQGGRIAFRFNDIVDPPSVCSAAFCEFIDIHGDQGDRGTVSSEVYGNTIITTGAADRWMHHRGGQAIIINNSNSQALSFNFTEYTSWAGNAGNPNNCGGWPAPDQITNTVYGGNVANGLPQAPTFSNGNSSPCGGGLSEDDYLQNGRDFWNASSGTEAARPGTCSDNTMYVATDTHKVFKCSPVNTWTTFFTPYPYPHPLRAVAGTTGTKAKGRMLMRGKEAPF